MATKKADNINDTDVLEAPINKASSDIPFSSLKTPERDSRIFLLSNDKRQGTVNIDLEEDVIDPASITPQNPKGNVRRMRLLRGAQSIWFDEQLPSVFPKEYVNKNILSLQFVKGKCLIPVHEKLKIKAAELTNRNTGNKNRFGAKDIYFYEWDPVIEAEKSIKDENEVITAMQLAATTPLAEMIPHAAYLNIQFQDEQGVPFEESALRTAYIRVAKNFPTKFLQSVRSPIVKTAFMVKNAINSGKIDLNIQQGAAYWHDGGFISQLPEGRDAADYLVEFAMTHGDANTAFANQLKALS